MLTVVVPLAIYSVACPAPSPHVRRSGKLQCIFSPSDRGQLSLASPSFALAIFVVPNFHQAPLPVHGMGVLVVIGMVLLLFPVERSDAALLPRRNKICASTDDRFLMDKRLFCPWFYPCELL